MNPVAVESPNTHPVQAALRSKAAALVAPMSRWMMQAVAGQRAARALAQRLVAEGRQVRVAIPPQPGSDFNDLLRGAQTFKNTEAPDVAA